MAYCTGCGKQLLRGVKFCDTCGTKVEDDVVVSSANAPSLPAQVASQERMPEQPIATSNRNWAMPIASVAVLAAIFFFFSRSGEIAVMKKTEAGISVAACVALEGSVNWRSFVTDANNPTLVIIEATVTKKKGKLTYQWLYNLETKGYKLRSAEIDGKPLNLYFDGYKQLRFCE